jgi:hypothetical protein
MWSPGSVQELMTPSKAMKGAPTSPTTSVASAASGRREPGTRMRNTPRAMTISAAAGQIRFAAGSFVGSGGGPGSPRPRGREEAQDGP